MVRLAAMVGQWLVIAALLLPVGARAQSSLSPDRVGDRFEVSRIAVTTFSQGDGASGSSSEEDRLMERVVAVAPAGVELEYDLLPSATADDRAQSWQFPARVMRAADGTLQLLNSDELEARVDGWLTRAGMTRAQCGRWIFTWSAFRIDCDPQSVIAMVEQFALNPAEPRADLLYRDPNTRDAMPLTLVRAEGGRTTYQVDLALDPDVVRRESVESAAVITELMGPQAAASPPPTINEVAGTIRVTFETDSAGRLQRRTSVMQAEIVNSDGTHEQRTATITLERVPIDP